MDIDAFRQMVAKNPKGFLGRYGLGNKILQEWEQQESKLTGGKVPLRRELIERGGSTEGRYGGSLEEAVEHLRVATQLDPVHVASHLALGRALAKLGRKDEAKPVLQAGINAAVSGRSNGGVDLVPEMRMLLQSLG